MPESMTPAAVAAEPPATAVYALGRDLAERARLADARRTGLPSGSSGLGPAVREHLDDPRTLVMPHLSFLAWGRKPEARPRPVVA